MLEAVEEEDGEESNALDSTNQASSIPEI